LGIDQKNEGVNMPLLSVIVPVYNETKTIRGILEKINSVDIDKEIIVIDDGSTDGTDKELRNTSFPNLKVIHHTSNRGKGAAFLTGLAKASGEFVIIQDGDLEYEPAEYLKLVNEMKKGDADMVLGVRFTAGYHGLFIPKLGNRLLTGLLNFFFGSKINDCMSCYKLLRRDIFMGLNLKSQGFGIDTEVVAKILKKGLRIKQVPIFYSPRTYGEGKKIKLIDGIRNIGNIIKYRLFD